MKTKHILTATLLSGVALFLGACATAGASSTSGAPAAPQSGVKPYPLKTCIVTDNALDSMGDEQTFVYQGQEIKVCCDSCTPKFLKNPAKYLGKLK